MPEGRARKTEDKQCVEEDETASSFTATCQHMLCSMANSGCLLVSNSGMLPHSLPCPPAFLYLQQVSDPLLGIFLLCGSHVLSLSEGSEFNLFLPSLSRPPRRILPTGALRRVGGRCSSGATSVGCGVPPVLLLCEAVGLRPGRAGLRRCCRRAAGTAPAPAAQHGTERSVLCARGPRCSGPGRGGSEELRACVHLSVSVCCARSRRGGWGCPAAGMGCCRCIPGGRWAGARAAGAGLQAPAGLCALSFSPNFPSGLAAPGCCPIPSAEFQARRPRGRAARDRRCFLQKPLCCIGNPSLPAGLTAPFVLSGV